MKLILALMLFVSVAGAQTKYTGTDSIPKYYWKADTISIGSRMSSVVFSIDTMDNVTVPAGWEWVIVIKDGQMWSVDSSKTNREFSQPRNWWGNKQKVETDKALKEKIRLLVQKNAKLQTMIDSAINRNREMLELMKELRTK